LAGKKEGTPEYVENAEKIDQGRKEKNEPQSPLLAGRRDAKGLKIEN